ncbi:MAG: hypothetical protein A3J38_10605 [Gammaproteobacteria bacterium RIFCSPHIGHO2_12_FULL_45_9]|nr:MAG: hypothetical protein A3J38_10605 [Gammaproteobacteria bacterium RIFCSPHIGHO2_12_FULL_45_9]
MRIALQQMNKMGDVILTFPMAALIKEHIPTATVILIGREPVRDIVALSADIDEFYAAPEHAVDESVEILKLTALKLDAIIHVATEKKPILKWAKQAGVPLRIGVWNRMHHIFTCNRRIYNRRCRVQLSEAVLNVKLLKGLGIPYQYTFQALNQKIKRADSSVLDEHVKALLDPERCNIILHPGSSAVGFANKEWPEAYFLQLVSLLDPKQFKVFVTGAQAEEYERFKKLAHATGVTNLMGQLTVSELIQLVQYGDGVVSCSTGPLHVAGLLDKSCLGLYLLHPSKNAVRWGPFGSRTDIVVPSQICSHCEQTDKPKEDLCRCMWNLRPEDVAKKIEDWVKVKGVALT